MNADLSHAFSNGATAGNFYYPLPEKPLPEPDIYKKMAYDYQVSEHYDCQVSEQGLQYRYKRIKIFTKEMNTVNNRNGDF